MKTSLQIERDLIVSLIVRGYKNKQIQQATGVSYRRITSIRSNIPQNVVFAGQKNAYYMRDGFWDEWELAVYRIFGGRKRVHLNP